MMEYRKCNYGRLSELFLARKMIRRQIIRKTFVQDVKRRLETGGVLSATDV
ncbi:MAG: hypothetical protein KAS66_13235 [Candidatus Omnitrophica bacterium]|nr:hypothetical protein [Candidatus Omnitrophota bacterium]